MKRQPTQPARDVFAEIERVRARIADAKELRDRTVRLPVTRAEALARVEAWISSQAERAPKHLGEALCAREYNGQVELDSLSLRGVGGIQFDLVPFIAKALPELLRDVLTSDVDSFIATNAGAIDEPTFAKRLAVLEREIESLEREEEALVRMLEEQGIDVDRRAAARPTIVLAPLATLPVTAA